MSEPTLRAMNILTYLTTRVYFAMAEVDVILIECPAEEMDGKPVLRIEYIGAATPQEVIDCAKGAGDFGYVVQSRQWEEKIGVR